MERAWRHVGEDVWRPFIEQFQRPDDPPGLAAAFAGSLISHRYDFTAVEYADRWSFEVDVVHQRRAHGLGGQGCRRSS